MKKLMIAAGIVCATVVAQAASVEWGTDDLYGSNGEYISDNTSEGYTYTAIATIAALGDSTGTMTWDSFSGSWDNAALTTDYTATLVITEYLNGKENATLTASGAFTSGASESFAKSINFSAGDGFTSGSFIGDGQGQWQTVPEPTSGLLLLLGVAGLALRRRRA